MIDDLERALAEFAPALGASEDDAPPEPLLADTCTACRLGYHAECDLAWLAMEAGTAYDEQCCCGGEFDAERAIQAEERMNLLVGGAGYVPAPGDDDDGGRASTLREFPSYWGSFLGEKPLEEYRDANSAGRKIAAKVAPIEPGMICEWAWLASAGGGVVPVMGCPGRPASDRHHGPDKNTMRNELGTNLHRICDWCHNQWHAKNDPFYGKRAMREDGTIDPTVPFVPAAGLPVVPHDPHTRASDRDVYEEDARRREDARRHGANI